MVYYVHAAVCVCLFLLWLIFYNDHPGRNRFVTEQELEKIHRGKSQAHIRMDSHVPYKVEAFPLLFPANIPNGQAILTNRLVWIVWINAFADLFSGMFLLMYIPTYLKSVLHFGIEQTGFLGALPSVAHMPLKFLFGYSSDKFKFALCTHTFTTLPEQMFARTHQNGVIQHCCRGPAWVRLFADWLFAR